ncbi:MAG: hypothetical protein TUN42_02910 [Dehalogenimonas sp.]
MNQLKVILLGIAIILVGLGPQLGLEILPPNNPIEIAGGSLTTPILICVGLAFSYFGVRGTRVLRLQVSGSIEKVEFEAKPEGLDELSRFIRMEGQ